ncbi:MAG: hypothetical protein ABIA93_00480 [Candidatus Woesearchaeota archaeon]
MGLLNWLRKKEEQRTLTLEEMPKFLDELVSKRDLSKQMQEYREELARQKSLLDLALNRLESAGLLNEGIPPREKSIALGNKQRYAQRIRQFMKELDAPKEFSAMENFATKLTEDFEALSKETHKNIFILKEFYATNANDVLTTLATIERATVKVRELLSGEQSQKINNARKALDAYNEAEQALELMNAEKKEQDEELNRVTAKLEELKKKHDALSKGTRFKDYEKQQERSKSIKEEEKKVSNGIFQAISILERSLRKQAKDSLNEELIKKYLIDHVEALIEDSKLQFAGILSKLDLEKHEPKQKKREKAKEALEQLSKTKLNEARNKLLELDKERKELDARLKSHPGILETKEFETRIQHAEKEKERAEERVAQTAARIERISLQLMKQRLNESLKPLNAVLA